MVLRRLLFIFFLLNNAFGLAQETWQDYTKIADSLEKARQVNKASIYRDRAINAVNLSAISPLDLINLKYSTAKTYREIGRLDVAVTMFNEALAIYKDEKVENEELLGNIYFHLAQTYGFRYINNPNRYINYLQKARNSFEKVEGININMLTNIYTSLSVVENSRGNFKEATHYLKKSFATYNNYVAEVANSGKNFRDITKEIELHTFLIEMYWLRSDETNMLFHLNEILKLSKIKAFNDTDKDLTSLAHLFVAKYYRQEDSEGALNYIKKGMKFFPDNDYAFLAEEYNLEKVKIFMSQNKLQEAQSITTKLRKEDRLPSFLKKNMLEQIIIINIKLGEYDNAKSTLKELLELFSKENSFFDIETTLPDDFTPSEVIRDTNHILYIIKAFEDSENKDYEIIDKLYWMALKQFQHNFNQEILNDRIKSMFDKICDYFYSKAAKSKLNEKETIEFITFTEQTTSKYLINTYLDNRTDSNNTKIDSLINEEQLIRANITYLKRRNQNKLSDSINQLVFDETLKLKAIDEKLKKSENRTALFFKNHFSFNKLDKHFIIQFKAIDSNMYRIVFNKGNVSVHKINDFINLRNKIINVVNQLKDISSSINDMNKDIAVVSNALLEGLNFSEITTSLNIIPDDVLHYLPFELLTKNGEHLLQDHNISYITSISFLNTPNVTINHPKEIALFAPSYQLFAPSGLQLAVRGEPYYLEGTIKEVDAISKLFDKPEVFLKDYATKSSFKGLPNDYNILHLSMHSFLNDQDSELSSLVFSDGTEDYELYISELYGLNLNANMAVLSACNTGVGDVKTGKGIVSMNTAFTAAGVPAVLSSLWSAPDIATQQIMTFFYKHLKNGESKDLALKNAKLDYLNNTEDPNLRHPYYWAGFVLTGDTSPIILDNSVDWWIYIIGVLVVLVLLFIATKKRLKFN